MNRFTPDESTATPESALASDDDRALAGRAGRTRRLLRTFLMRLGGLVWAAC